MFVVQGRNRRERVTLNQHLRSEIASEQTQPIFVKECIMKKRIILLILPLMGLVASLIPQEVLADTCSKCCTRGRWPFRIKDCCGPVFGGTVRCYCDAGNRAVCESGPVG